MKDGCDRPSERSQTVGHKLTVSVSGKTGNGGIASALERPLRFLPGKISRAIVLIPGNRIDEITINEEVKNSV